MKRRTTQKRAVLFDDAIDLFYSIEFHLAHHLSAARNSAGAYGTLVLAGVELSLYAFASKGE
jgi:hypothetical protein